MIGIEFAGTISKELGSTMGKLEGTIKDQLSQLKSLATEKAQAAASPITSRVEDIKKQSSQSKELIKICKKIKRILNNIQGPIEKIALLVAKIVVIIKIAKSLLKILSALLKLLKANPTVPVAPPIPVPTAPGTTVPGIPMIYPSSGQIVTTNQEASKTQETIKKITGILDGLSKVLKIVAISITSIIGILVIIKPLLKSLCPDNLTGPIDSNIPPPNLTEISAASDISLSDPIDNIINQLNNLIPKDLLETEDSYKGYTFEVIEDITQKSASGKVNKRYAIARNEQGIEVFRSKSSFATDKQILIAELKFKIDNELSTGFVQELT